MKRGYGYLLVCASLSACAALTDLGSIAPSADAGPKKCIAGETQPCVGAGACVGGQACKADGAGYEACVCGSPPAVDGGDGSVTDSAMSADGGDGSAPPGMVSIPAHTFADGGVIAAFYMDKTEVTVSAYAACVGASKCTAANTTTYCNAGVAGRDNHPINCVDWDQSTAYCGWAGKRLPTEEEWQYAADTADGRVYPWGNATPDTQLCWNGPGNTLGQGNRTSTCAVGSFPTGDSPFGLSDMSGNVWEWTSSAYDSQTRVLRGGGWDDGSPSVVRAAYRAGRAPSNRYNNLGFRCSR